MIAQRREGGEAGSYRSTLEAALSASDPVLRDALLTEAAEGCHHRATCWLIQTPRFRKHCERGTTAPHLVSAPQRWADCPEAVSYTHLRAHET